MKGRFRVQPSGCARRASLSGFRAASLNSEPNIQTLIALIISESLLDKESFDVGINAIGDWRNLPDAAIWFSLSFAEGVRSDFVE